MKTKKILLLITWITLGPLVFLLINSLISQFLISINICTSYNGSDFGDAAICNVFPMISYFGGILILFTSLGLGKFIGTITLISYFIFVFVHNRRNHDNSWNYSKSMIILACIFIIASILSPIMKAQKEKAFYEKHTTPTETLFVCDENYSLEKSDIAIWENVIKESGSVSSSRICTYNKENETYTWYSSYKASDEREKTIKTWKNINGETIFDQYGTIEKFEIKIKDMPYNETIFECNDNHFIQFILVSSHVVDRDRVEKDILLRSTTLGKIDANTKTFTWTLDQPSENQKTRLTTCKNNKDKSFFDIFQEIPLTAIIDNDNLKLDSDNDGLSDAEENKIGTDINNPDTDNDGYSDGEEVKNGFNPLK